MQKTVLTVAVLVVALSLTACGAETGSTSSQSSSASDAGSTQEAQPMVTTVTVTRSGGLKGGTDRVTYDRTASYPSGAPALDLARAADHLRHEQPTPKPQGGGDRYEYTVTVTWDDDTTKTFHAIDAGEISPALRQTLAAAF